MEYSFSTQLVNYTEDYIMSSESKQTALIQTFSLKLNLHCFIMQPILLVPVPLQVKNVQ